MTKLAMAIDLARCVGCHTCSLACKMSNDIPDGMLWNRILTEGADVMDGVEGTYPNVSRECLPLACQHCENPACQKVCPTGATYKDEQGRVEIDYEKCIGCRMCMAACPCNARTFNWNEPVRSAGGHYGYHGVKVRQRGVMEKCMLCPERVADGKEPMCVAVCPALARTYGDLDDPDSEASKMRRGNNVRILLEDKGTRPQVFYVR